MARPRKIYLIRHGESEGNVNKDIYKTKPDYALLLTKKGIKEAAQTGQKLRTLLNGETTAVYWSPFFRSRQTTHNILLQLESHQYSRKFMREEPTLREQEWGGTIREDGSMTEAQKERDIHGHFLYRFNRGQSCADLDTQLSDFFHTLHRDFEKSNYPKNVIISTHGMTMRVFIRRWFHTKFEEFELWANPKNGEIWEMELNPDTHKYVLKTEIRKYDEPRSQFAYPFGEVGARPKKDFRNL